MDVSAPTLPLDLERRIFELAFHCHSDSVLNLRLLLVAKRTAEWIRPLIYSVFDQYRVDNAFPDYKKYPNTPKIEDIGPSAKHLICNGRTHFDTTEEVQSFLECCPNIENLACWGDRPSFVELVGVLSKLKNLRHLSVSLSGIPKESLEIPLFSAITRLELLMPWVTFPYEIFGSFKSLKQLSIFGGETAMDDDMIRSVFTYCPWLELYAITDGDNEFVSREIYEWCMEETRLVVFDGEMCTDEDWLRGARGGHDFWAFLANIVFARKCGFFIPGEYQSHRYKPDFDWPEYLTPEGKIWYKTISV